MLCFTSQLVSSSSNGNEGIPWNAFRDAKVSFKLSLSNIMSSFACVITRDLSVESYYSEVGPLQNLITSIVPPSSSSELSFLTQNTIELDSHSPSSKQSNDIYDKLQTASNNDGIFEH